MYALRLDSEGRILEVMDPRYASGDTPIVDNYPDGLLYHYRYVSGKFVYDPPEGTPEQESSGSVWDDLAEAIREGVNSV